MLHLEVQSHISYYNAWLFSLVVLHIGMVVQFFWTKTARIIILFPCTPFCIVLIIPGKIVTAGIMDP